LSISQKSLSAAYAFSVCPRVVSVHTRSRVRPYDREPISAHPAYDVSPDGQRFLMLKTVVPGAPTRSLQVVFGWLGEVIRQVPPG
jgi:hypothetical protein